MTPNFGGWIHSFAITETKLHKGGYTVYKITSIVFPRAVPQALSALTVWKRFHEIKKLHRELNRRFKALNLPGQLPEPIDCSFFKRFDASIIKRRKDYILELLDFVAQHPPLYKCYAFSSFFSDGQQLIATPEVSPLHRLHLEHVKNICKSASNAIVEICDKFDLRYDSHDGEYALIEPEKCSDNFAKQNAELNEITDKLTLETASVEEECTIATKTTEITTTTTNAETLTALPKITDKICKDNTRFLTPMASIESDDSDYIYEAALEFSHAVQAEANLEYKEAHTRYKRGVELLLNGSKDDANDERKYIAKTKVTKYLARADDIYDKFLRDAGKENAANHKIPFQLSIDVTDAASDTPALYLERPWNHLVKYKVVQVLGECVMQVQCITEPQRPMYIMKGIEKPSSNSPTQTIFLPQHVPYMVDLLAFFQCEQKIFLLLKQAEGGRLYDYIETYTPTPTPTILNSKNEEKSTKKFSRLFPNINDEDDVNVEDNDLNAFTDVDAIDIASEISAQDSGYMDFNESNSEVKPEKPASIDEVDDVDDILRCSQQLLASVSNTLKEIKALEETPTKKQEMQLKIEEEEQQQQKTAAVEAKCEFKKFHKIPEASLKQWARELACAIDSLHAKGVILGDLNMQNLLLGAKGQLLLTYFYQHEGEEAADNYVHKAPSDTAILGHFVAPERPLTFKSDWWSYGVVLYQLLLGLPFKAAHPGQLDLYGYVQYPENANISDEARDLLDNLLQQTADERYDFAQIKIHAFFKGTNWTDVQQNGFNVTIQKAAGNQQK